ncbi:hypothetical protein F5Y12DRAFT_712067 [Xylaria sp. FL1777]|nr:hypothetical protein F5Y12DRAFT_712067 [Xylaria sp. FL1777]
MRQTRSIVTAPRFKRIVSKVEVERKFNLGPNFASIFLSKEREIPQAQRRKVCNNPGSPFFIVVRQPGQIIRDIYYDTQNDQLSKLGLWVRQRHVQSLALNSSGQKNDQDHEGDSHELRWNAKVRLGGHFNNSQFVEVDGKKNVSDEVLKITDSMTKLEDLQVVTDLQTRRSSWEVAQLADGTTPSAKMTIVMDEVTEAKAGKDRSGKSVFTHTIGEVELFQEFVTEGKDKAEHEAQRKRIAARRMEELKEFMFVNPDLFATTPTPIGKLSAYYTWKNTRT